MTHLKSPSTDISQPLALVFAVGPPISPENWNEQGFIAWLLSKAENEEILTANLPSDAKKFFKLLKDNWEDWWGMVDGQTLSRVINTLAVFDHARYANILTPPLRVIFVANAKEARMVRTVV